MIAWTIFRNSLPLQLVALAVAGWAALGANNIYREHVGASKAVTTINEQSKELAHDALEARKPADTPGAVGRLRQRYCNNCDAIVR